MFYCSKQQDIQQRPRYTKQTMLDRTNGEKEEINITQPKYM